jgi:DNA-directed RNA polymerase sigma subunit (sigma70/sigma32)
LRRISRQLKQEWGRQPTAEELVPEMELSPAKVHWMLRASQESDFLVLRIGNAGNAKLGDFIKSDIPVAPDCSRDTKIEQCALKKDKEKHDPDNSRKKLH